MSEETGSTGWKEMVVGFAIILGGVIGLIYLGRTVYTRVFKPTPAIVSISSHFVDDTGKPVYATDSPAYSASHLKIEGAVSRGEQAVKTGAVLITVATTNDLFRQSVLVPLKEGRFETDDPAFFPVRPGVASEVRADVMAEGITQSATIRLNSESPVDESALAYGLWVGILILAVVFFLAFTGKKKAWRNQTAIIFSYVIIGLFLAVPIVGPVMLIHTFPKAIDTMIGAPAGLVNTHTANQEPGETQWALNIGGYSYKAPAQGGIKSDDGKGADKGSPPAGNATLSGAAINSDKPAAAVRDSGQISSHVAGQVQEGNKPPAGNTTAPDASTSHPPVIDSAELKPPIVQVQGGLVIPLYVIILSVIGGAINMTRKVPGFQKEGEESDFAVGRPISSLGSRALKIVGLAPTQPEAPAPEVPAAEVPERTQAADKEISPEDQAREIEKKLDPLVRDQITRNGETDRTLADIRSLVVQMQQLYKARKSDEPLLKFNSFEDWAASHPRLSGLLRGSWRVELLNQYMYLISAPFLAIVTYYVLDLLGLSKQGVVVVLSFSVGLISEKIVSWILGIATGYLRTDTGKP